MLILKIQQKCLVNGTNNTQLAVNIKSNALLMPMPMPNALIIVCASVCSHGKLIKALRKREGGNCKYFFECGMGDYSSFVHDS